jgi:general L-amino acid transport system substrate-binding protein
MLARNTTWTFSRDVDPVRFVVNYYGRPGLHGSEGPAPLGQGSGATICVQTAPQPAGTLVHFRKNNIARAGPDRTNAEGQQQYLAGACDVLHHRHVGSGDPHRATFETPGDRACCPKLSR